MTHEVLIAGGGLGGLAASIAARRAGWEARVCEQAAAFSEVGAGIQLGPNSSSILRDWGLLNGPLREQVARPLRLAARDAVQGVELGALALGDFEARYGAPYLTVHRADLQAALLRAAVGAGVRLHTGAMVEHAVDVAEAVQARVSCRKNAVEADALVVADGLWSRLRALVVDDGAPRAIGHLAYRGLIAQRDLPARLRAADVTAWLGPRLHAVIYPVRGGEMMNVVCVVEGRVEGDPRLWDHAAVADGLRSAAGPLFAPLQEVLLAVPEWRLWALHAREPVAGAHAMARGRVALLGDAAHPMLPYLAQGAGMAFEDAAVLSRALHAVHERVIDTPTALRRYALQRWERCARVQARARRNGWIFHLDGPLRHARDVAMQVGGERVLDVPWLYGYAA